MKAIILLALIAFARAVPEGIPKDQIPWAEKGDAIAAKDLDKWHGASDDELQRQIGEWRDKVIEAVNNLKTLGENLKQLFGSMKKLTDGTPYLHKRAAMRLLLWNLIGQRDHLSYYYFQGAIDWVDKRVPLTGNKALVDRMQAARQAIYAAQQELDGGAQKFLKAQEALRSMVGDMGDKIEDMRRIVDALIEGNKNSALPGLAVTALVTIQEVKP